MSFCVKSVCVYRDGLEVPAPAGFRFDGNGYIVMPKERFDYKARTTVVFKFRTFAENGLLVLMGDGGSSFFSVELKDGRILYKFDLGSGASHIITEVWQQIWKRLVGHSCVEDRKGWYCVCCKGTMLQWIG